MNSELVACQFCQKNFSEIREPYLLPDCGHSVCAECLQSKLSQLKSFKCKEDGQLIIIIKSPKRIAVTRSNFSDFPKNFAVIQLLKGRHKRQNSFIVQKFADEDHDSSSNSDKCPTNISGFTKQISDTEIDVDRCQKHKKKLEIICIDDKLKICSSCALFGQHVNHKVIPIEEAVNKTTQRVQQLYELYLNIEVAAKDVFEQSQYFNIVEQLYQQTQQNSTKEIENIFEALYKQLEIKKNSIIKEVKQKIIQKQEQTFKHIQEMLIETQRKVDLWKISSSSKITYFTEKTEKKEIAFDLIATSSTLDIFQIGQQLLKDMQLSKQNVTQKLDELQIRDINIEFKQDFDQFLNNIILHDFNQRYDNSVTRMVDSVTDISLLKDINNSIIQDPMNQRQTEINVQKYQEFQRLRQLQQEENLRQIQYTQQCYSQTLVDQQSQLSKSSSSNNLRRVSPSPIRRSAKSKKINEKFQPIILKLRQDNLDTADFSQAELGDEGLLSLITIIIKSKQMRTLKLAKNKLQDASVKQFLTELIEKQSDQEVENNQISTINLSSNMITDHIIDVLLDLCRRYKPKFILSSIYLNQNIINLSKVKKKVEDMKRMGLTVQI